MHCGFYYHLPRVRFSEHAGTFLLQCPTLNSYISRILRNQSRTERPELECLICSCVYHSRDVNVGYCAVGLGISVGGFAPIFTALL
jgi:hypothetical protein